MKSGTGPDFSSNFSEAKEKLKDLLGKIVKIAIEEEKEVANPLLDFCGWADIEIKDGSFNHDKYINGRT